MIDLSHIEKIYDSPSGPVRAIKDISLHINRGEIYGIIGLSGAGKSTLVRCINLLEWPTSGSILLIRITFIGESANEPVISRLIKNFDLNVGIFFGSLDDIKGVPFGRLMISLVVSRPWQVPLAAAWAILLSATAISVSGRIL